MVCVSDLSFLLKWTGANQGKLPIGPHLLFLTDSCGGVLLRHPLMYCTMMPVMTECYRAGRICQETDPKTDAVRTFCCSNYRQSTGTSFQEICVNGMQVKMFFVHDTAVIHSCLWCCQNCMFVILRKVVCMLTNTTLGIERVQACTP